MRAEKGMVVLFLPQPSEWIAWPKGRCLPHRLRSPHRKKLSPPSVLRRHPSPPSCSVFGTAFPSPQLSALSFCSPSQYHFLFLRSSSSWQLLRAEAPSWRAGGQDPGLRLILILIFSLHFPACRPWNYSLPSRMPSSVTFIRFPGWMERPGQRPRTR